MCKSQSSWFRCRLLTKNNLITNQDDLVTVHLIDWGMERQVIVSGFLFSIIFIRLFYFFFLNLDIREMPQSFVSFFFH